MERRGDEGEVSTAPVEALRGGGGMAEVTVGVCAFLRRHLERPSWLFCFGLRGQFIVQSEPFARKIMVVGGSTSVNRLL